MTLDPNGSVRPSPDALLSTARAAGKGRLKIFLGAAPGVGKTYEMLLMGQARKRDGADVAIGIVETHGRPETAALMAGLEVIPPRQIDYKGRKLQEMDIDAILARRPQLVLVDELAHTNAPNSRHPKRYLDVEELLAAGIDVFTTLNIQHVESLNDVVARITRIRVRETVPDSILDQADDIEVIDLAPADLIQRLQDGKVYVPHQAQRALQNYFSPGNLTALRELALRRTAQRVDAQMLNYMQSHAISGPWAAGDRLLVCINEHPSCAGLIRHARRVADQLRASWTVLYVQTARHHRLNNAERDRIADHLRLAEKLGADALSIPGGNIADDLIAYARANNVTLIMIGKSARTRWFELLYGSVVRDLVAKAGSISIQVMAGDAPAAEPARAPAAKANTESFRPAPYAATTIVIAAALLVGLALQQTLAVSSISLVFLTAVLLCAVGWGLWPSLFACLLSALAYNFFFLPPFYTFTIADPENVVALFFFLVVALITSNVTARTRVQVITARTQARNTSDLYAFSRKVAAASNLDDLLWATAYQIALMLKVRVVLLLPLEGRLEVRSGYPPEDELDEADMAAAAWTMEHNRPAGRGADTLPGAKRLFMPLRTGRGAVGVIGIDRDAPGPLLTPDERRLLDSLSDQAALGIERIGLARDIDAVRVLAETEHLRTALLTSISHDLRTPLASIIGAVTSLRRYGNLYDEKGRDDLLATAQEEAERLNRFVANLLDMTRLDSGALTPKREKVDIADLVGTALRRTAPLLANHRVNLDLAGDLPMLALDFVLTEQILVNLLDNAAKYSPTDTVIDVRARRVADAVRIEVLDQGPGIPADELGRIFDKFYRVQNSDRQRAGIGLGLAICRGFAEAQGGTIEAANRIDEKGAVFTLEFPIGPQDDKAEGELL